MRKSQDVRILRANRICCSILERAYDAQRMKRALVKFRTVQIIFSLRISLCRLLTESVDAVLYVEEQKMPRLDCIDVHGELDIHRLKLQKGPFHV